MDLRRSHIQKAVNAAPTASEGRNIRRAAGPLMGALRQGESLLDTEVIDLANVLWHGIKDTAATASESCELYEFVSTWRPPSIGQVKALRLAAERTGGHGRGQWWRGLVVEVAAHSGPRWSELIALITDRIDAQRRTARINWRVSQPSGVPRSLAPFKMAKRRTTIYPEASLTGYPFGLKVKQRIEAARTEQSSGRN